MQVGRGEGRGACFLKASHSLYLLYELDRIFLFNVWTRSLRPKYVRYSCSQKSKMVGVELLRIVLSNWPNTSFSTTWRGSDCTRVLGLSDVLLCGGHVSLFHCSCTRTIPGNGVMNRTVKRYSALYSAFAIRCGVRLKSCLISDAFVLAPLTFRVFWRVQYITSTNLVTLKYDSLFPQRFFL